MIAHVVVIMVTVISRAEIAHVVVVMVTVISRADGVSDVRMRGTEQNILTSAHQCTINMT